MLFYVGFLGWLAVGLRQSCDQTLDFTVCHVFERVRSGEAVQDVFFYLGSVGVFTSRFRSYETVYNKAKMEYTFVSLRCHQQYTFQSEMLYKTLT